MTESHRSLLGISMPCTHERKKGYGLPYHMFEIPERTGMVFYII
jgi:hypothetical protein